MYRKFDDCNFSHSRGLGASKLKIGHMTATMPICRPKINTLYGQPVYKI